MIHTLDLSTLDWTIAGYPPHGWRFLKSMETGVQSLAEIAPCPAKVPGSVQHSLLEAKLIPDWNVGANARESEWVENRHWIYRTCIPATMILPTPRVLLRCDGLDYSGWVVIDGVEIASFRGSLIPHVFDLTPHITPGRDLHLEIIFDSPPRWLGQFGYTSQMRDWKPRFNYTWDWMPRLVQTGIWQGIALEFSDSAELHDLAVRADADLHSGAGTSFLQGCVDGSEELDIQIRLRDEQGQEVLFEMVTALALSEGLRFTVPDMRLWYTNGLGEQPLYHLDVELCQNGSILDRRSRRVGFRHVDWLPNKNSSPEMDPWICAVNGIPVFLQGINWTPIRPNFADIRDEDYHQRVTLYRDLGVNIFRVWGGAFLEKELFYDLCDAMGIMVWQEFPLAASGVENWPPEDPQSIEEMDQIVRSYIARRQHHVSLIMWCGGNEMQGALDGGKVGTGKPVTMSHPMIARMAHTVAKTDPERRFVPVSSSGPRFMADQCDYGKGQHWDVHGPWMLGSMTMDEWQSYWVNDDALFRSGNGSARRKFSRSDPHLSGQVRSDARDTR